MRKKIKDADTLIRYHEELLFLRAYPKNAATVREVEKELRHFADRVAALDIDPAPLQHPEVSGIAGTSVTDTFSFYIVRWLLRRHPTEVTIDWEWFEDENRLAETWPRFIPLLEEDTFVEANIPYREWLAAARRGRAELPWLMERFNALPKTDKERAELYDSQQLYVRWTPDFSASRTGMRLPTRRLFYHRGPLIQRRDVDLAKALVQPVTLTKISERQGEQALDMARDASTIRYRELYGFTHGDPKHVYHVELGRGVELYLAGLPPDKRLPLRAYHAAMIYKNGVPIGYFEGLSLFERMESGFNLYYTFRDGEAAWLYARTLNVMHKHAGVTAFSLDPYQIGHENEEGIESGAFWFYRKLGFRPVKPELMKLTEREEVRAAKDSGYRTSAATLRKLAAGHMLFELSPQKSRGCWDNFEVRNIGLAVQRRMAGKYESDGEEIRNQSAQTVRRALRINTRGWHDEELSALQNLSLVLASDRDLNTWTAEQKELAARVIRAKAGRDEASYLKLMQKHAAFRDVLMRLGCR
jgi:hypothetical protein